MKSLRFFTFGCKANQYDSQFMMEFFSKQGYSIDNRDYDIAVVNTCCVTKKAESEAKTLIKKLVKNKKQVWITGCLVEKNSFSMPETKILKRGFIYQQAKLAGMQGIEYFYSHTRAFVKIVDGCENFCSYCIVPFVRGKIKSREISEIISEVKKLVENSYKEIVFTGIDLGGFGKDTEESLKELLQKVNKVKGLERFRLSSIEVFYIDDELLKVLKKSDKFCPSFHIPLQSGSDRILKLMGRPYSFVQYKNTLEKIKAIFKDVCFTTDIIVGFPGETEDDFELSLKAIEECSFLKVHIFPFSLHPQTKAASLPDRISELTKKQRLKRAIELAEKVSLQVKKQFIGKKLKVLVERKIDDFWFGYSQYYVPVVIDSPLILAGKIIEVLPQETKTIKNTVYLFAKQTVC